MLTVDIEISGDKRTLDRLRKISGAFNDWSPELRNISNYLMDFYQNQVFETEGGIFGSRWQPLSPKYEFRKRKKWGGRGILEASGALRKGYKERVGRTEMEIRNNVGYGYYHQKGKGYLPVRILLKLDSARRKEVVDIFKSGLVKRIRQAA